MLSDMLQLVGSFFTPRSGGADIDFVRVLTFARHLKASDNPAAR